MVGGEWGSNKHSKDVFAVTLSTVGVNESFSNFRELSSDLLNSVSSGYCPMSHMLVIQATLVGFRSKCVIEKKGAVP